MNKFFKFFFLIISSIVFAQSIEDGTPPYTLKINDSLYIDKSPVPIEFIYEKIAFEIYNNRNKIEQPSKKTDRKPSFFKYVNSLYANINYRPELSLKKGSSKYDIQSFKHDIYYTSSFNTAIEYCQWRTKVTNEVLQENGLKYKILYRIPTTIELKSAELHFKSQKNLKAKMLRNPLEYKLNTNSKKFQVYNIPEYSADGLFKSSRFEDISDLGTLATFRCICEKQELK